MLLKNLNIELFGKILGKIFCLQNIKWKLGISLNLHFLPFVKQQKI